MEQLTDAMITVMKTINKLVENKTPYNSIETIALNELAGKLEDADVDEAIFELLNSGILKSDVDPIVFPNGLMYRPITGISDYGKSVLSELSNKIN
jgi:methyltransferase-like protein